MSHKIYPFKFLDAYTAEDKDLFFGRDEEIKQLYQMIYQSDTLLLYGASGTGKTSLIQCGLASQFQQHDWLEVFVRRHKNLNESLNKALLAIGGAGESTTSKNQALDWLDDIMGNESGPVTNKIQSTTQDYLKNIYLKHFRPIYLIFDQFEELFILGSEAEQKQFITTIQEILQVEQPVKLIFSIREEYLGSLYEFEKAVPALLRKKLRIDPMNLEKVKAVVLGATASDKSIVNIKTSEADQIAEQVFEKIRGQEKTLTIQLPYLQVFLDKFYRHISNDKSKHPTTEATFTLAALSELGDINDVLRDFLDEQIVEIAKEQGTNHKTIWKILSPFVTVDGTKEPIGLESLTQQLPDLRQPLIKQVVASLMNRRILRFIEDEALFEVAHDSLALRIAEKRSDDEIALLEVRNLIKSQSLLKDEARELFSEKQLEFISPYLPLLLLSPVEAKLIEESKVQVLKEQREKRRRKIVGAILLGLFIAIILAFALYSQGQKATALKAEAAAVESERHAVAARETAEKDRHAAVLAKQTAEEAKQNLERTLLRANKSERQALIAQRIAEDRKQQAMTAERHAKHTAAEAQMAKNQAVESQQKAIAAQLQSEEDKQEALAANKKNEKIISAMDFYDDKLALAFHNGKYGFINKEGEAVIDYEYDRGEPFDAETGYAEMQILDSKNISLGVKKDHNYLSYWVDKEGHRLRMIHVEKLLKENGYNESVLSPIDADWLKKKIARIKKQAPLLNKINNIEVSKAVANKELLTILKEEPEQLALDFKGIDRKDIRIFLETIAAEDQINRKVEMLQLKGTNIKKLTESISKFENLKELDISYTGIQRLPKSLTSLQQLTVLDASISQLTEIPKDIGKLQQLKKLYLPNYVNNTPHSLFDLKNIEVIELENSDSTTIPETIGQLTKLRILRLGTQVSSFPRNFSKLKKLEILEITTDKMTVFPKEICQLKQLKRLTIKAPLKALPTEISQLEHLNLLQLPTAKLEQFPEEITQLKKLKILHLKGLFTELPKAISQMNELIGLHIIAPLASFPEELLELSELFQLVIKNTTITKLPKDIGRLSKLKVFKLSAPIAIFPEEILTLKNLKTLILENAQLTSIPDKLNQLKKLSDIQLWGTFKEFPSSILALKQLKTLTLISPNLAIIPEEIGNLNNLSKLTLNGSFKRLPESTTKLSKLLFLNIKSPKLELLPDDLGNLKSLGVLFLSGNFSHIPSSFYQLKRLVYVVMFKCPNLKDVPDLFQFKSLQAFGINIYNTRNREKNIYFLKKYSEKKTNVLMQIIDEDGDYLDLSAPNFDLD